MQERSNHDLEQRIAVFERLAALQNPEMLFQPTPQQLLQQQQQFEAAVALQHHTAQSQMVGRQGAIKDVRSIIEDYRQKHPESVPRRGRRMKTVPTTTTNASLMHSSGSLMSSGGGGCVSSPSSFLMMAAMAANQGNSKSPPSQDEADFSSGGGGGCDDIDDDVLVMGGSEEGEVVVVADVAINKGDVVDGGQREVNNKSKRDKVAKDRQHTRSSKDGGVARRDCEWRAMLTTLSESGTTATSIRSRRSSNESLQSTTSTKSSAAAINNLLTQHGLLPAISVTSISGGGGGSSGPESGAGRGPANGNLIIWFYGQQLLLNLTYFSFKTQIETDLGGFGWTELNDYVF